MTDAQTEAMLIRILESSQKNGKSQHLSVVTAILIAIGPTLAGTAAWLQARSTHVAVNSRMDAALLAASEKGKREGRTEERTEAAAAAILAPTAVNPIDSDLAKALMEVLRKYETK